MNQYLEYLRLDHLENAGTNILEYLHLVHLEIS